MKAKLFLLFFLLCSLAGKSQTIVAGGSVSGNWTLAGSPYLVQGSIMVPDGSTLTIDAGVTVNFQGHYKLFVQGKVLALGNATDSIFFTAANPSPGWYGVRFDNTPSTNDTSRFSYCSFNWGNASGSGVDAFGGTFMFNNFSKAVISHCLIRNSIPVGGISGGAIYCTNGNPVISYNTITRCTGGIYLLAGSCPDIRNNTISYNSGTGISIGSGIINCFNNTISHNSSTGIITNSCYGTIKGNTISYNNIGSSSYPGGIWLDNSALDISDNLISYNQCLSGGYGGGINCYSFTYSSSISHNVIVNNSSPTGGGIASIGATAAIITNNVISNNTAIASPFSTFGGYGGAIYSTQGKPELVNNTISNNTAIFGGGLAFFNPPSDSTNFSITSCILYGNTASSDGNQVYLNDEISDPGFYYCNIQGGTAAFGMNGNFYTGTYTANIAADPLFVAPSGGSGTGFNGAAADWSLAPFSPSINTGNPIGPHPLLDLAGNARVYGPAIDMGAYELQGTAGIHEHNTNVNLVVYPNPGTELITVQYNLAANGNVKISITNTLGQIIAAVAENAATGKNSVTINVKEYGIAPGAYFIVVESAGFKELRKIIITK